MNSRAGTAPRDQHRDGQCDKAAGYATCSHEPQSMTARRQMRRCTLVTRPRQARVTLVSDGLIEKHSSESSTG